MNTTDNMQTPQQSSKEETLVVNETQSTSTQTQLTKNVNDVSTLSIDAMESWLLGLRKMDPYPDQGLRQVLSRNYKINSFPWTTVATQGALLHQGNFPEDLFVVQSTSGTQVNSNLVDKLSSFRYFRSKVHVKITLNATKYHYGVIAVTWLPHYYSTAAGTGNAFPYKNFDMYQACNNNLMLMSASDTSSLEFDIPWITPYQYLDMQKYPTQPTWVSFIGQFQMWNLVPLRNASASGTDEVQVSIQASFVEPEVTGLVPYKYISTCPPAEFTAQTLDMEQLMKTVKGVTAGVQETTKGVSAIIESIPVVEDSISTAIGAFEHFFDKPTSISTSQPVNLALAPDMAAGNGVDYSNKIAMDVVNSVTTDASMFCENKKAMDYLRICRKPSLVHTGSFDSGTPEGEKLFVFPISPMTVHKGTPDYYTPTYLSYVSSAFTYWNGSLKYYIYFAASQFNTARVRLSWLPAEPTTTAPFEFGSGDFVSTVFDITGDKILRVTVPYVKPVWALQTGRMDDIEAPATLIDHVVNGYLCMHVYNPALTTQTTGASTIFYAVFMSAGEDYQLHKPRSVFPLYNAPYTQGPPAEAEPQALDMNKEFGCKFPTLIKGLKQHMHKYVIDGDRTDSSLNTLLHRYSLCFNYSAGSTTIERRVFPLDGSENTPSTASDDWRSFTYFSYLFMFWRGSLRYKFIGQEGSGSGFTIGNGLALLRTKNTFNALTPNADAFNGAVAYNMFYKPAAEIEIPFYDEVAFRPMVPRVLDTTLTKPYFALTRETSTDVGQLLYVAAGDDFTYGVLSAPPILRLST